MSLLARTLAASAVSLALTIGAAWAQQAQPANSAPNTVEAFKERMNRGTVGIVSGGVDGTYIRIAADLASVLDDGENLRVLATVGKGSLQNLADILFLRGIDIGIVQSDVLAYAKRERTYPGVEKQITYVTKLYNEELHILASKDIKSIQDLAGKPVNFDLRGSGTFMTASLLFDTLKIRVEPALFDQALALDKLKKGEIAAMAYVAGKPTRLFSGLRSEDNVHFLAVPLVPELLETYLPSRLSQEEYPQLVTGAPVDTIAVGAVMAVYNWPSETERYKKVARFVDAFFSKFDKFLEAPRHPKWKEVTLSAQVPGWTRFPAAEGWLRKDQTVALDPEMRKAFRAFLDQQSRAEGRALTAQQQEALFEQFVRWQRRNPQ